jgi:hypothetical protein
MMQRVKEIMGSPMEGGWRRKIKIRNSRPPA